MKEGASEFLLKTNSIRLVPAILSVVNQRHEREARLQAEEAQKQSEARFRSLAETSTAAILFIKVKNSFMSTLQQNSLPGIQTMNYCVKHFGN